MELAVAALVCACVLRWPRRTGRKMIKGQFEIRGGTRQPRQISSNFGVAPGLILYLLAVEQLNNGAGSPRWFSRSAGGLRLARFQRRPRRSQKRICGGQLLHRRPGTMGAITVLIPIYLAFLGLPRQPALITRSYTIDDRVLMVRGCRGFRHDRCACAGDAGNACMPVLSQLFSSSNFDRYPHGTFFSACTVRIS